MYTYHATLDRVVDGDTVDMNIDLGFNVWVKKRVRLHHVDTPEKRTRDLLEKVFGYLASDYVSIALGKAKSMVIKTSIDGPTDKYGRVLGEIWCDNDVYSINDQLIQKRYAVKYEGQNKSDVEVEHINNMRYLVESGEVALAVDIQPLYDQNQ
jgi:endonuclease YncB( thermonuclease family)